jgi:integrase
MLTDAAVRRAKPQDKQYKLADEKGMFLLITPAGSKLWRLKYRVDGKEKVLAFGQYPDVTLSDARDKRDAARKQIAEGLDPAVQKKAAKRARAFAAINTFESVATEWFATFSTKWTPAHSARVWSRIKRDILPWLGKKPVTDILTADVIETIKRVDARGARETAYRVRSDISVIMLYAIHNGLASRNPAPDSLGVIPSLDPKHRAAITEPTELAKLLILLDSYNGGHVVRTALKLQPILFCRPGELRQMHWQHIDFDKSLWEIPAELMKMREPHIVPLSKQAIALIKDMPKTASPYVFPSQRGQGRPMSDMATSAALKSLGIDTQTTQTMHGFRASARTILHEVLGVEPDVIEVALAHQPAGALRDAYNRTRFLDQRKEMMQRWADYLDEIKAKAQEG